ncbi:MAG TPA: ABC transporter ATP-binding protein [Acidimicrobiales bacterium]|nr:ABC transporter ATP-binding protein [Acidimicrobiales bacterium]
MSLTSAEAVRGPAAASSGWGLEIDRLTKVYDSSVRANDEISLRVEPGEVFGLLGPNGAGKSTLVKQLIGLLKPTGGSIRLGPHDLVADPAAARQLCSYLPQAPMPIESLRAEEAIRLTGAIRGGLRSAVGARASELLAELDIEEWRKTVGLRLSGGIRRLVGFAMVVVVPGRLVILDEPTNDVDPHRRRLLWQLIRRLGEEGSAVLLVTHNVMEAEKSVDRLAVIDGGRVVAEGTPSALKAADRGRMRLHLMLAPGKPTPDLPGYAAHPTRAGNNLVCVVDETLTGDAIAWARQQVSDGVAEEYALGATSLEDVYIRLTGHLSANGAEPTP